MRTLRNYLRRPEGIIGIFFVYVFLFGVLFHAFGKHFQHENGTSHIAREYAEDIAVQVCNQISGNCEIARDWEAKSANDLMSSNLEKSFIVALDPEPENIRFTIINKKMEPDCLLSSQPQVSVDTVEYFFMAEQKSQVRATFCAVEKGHAHQKQGMFEVSSAIQKYNRLHKKNIVKDFSNFSAWIKYFAFSVKATTSLGFGDVVTTNRVVEASVSLFALVSAIFWAFIVGAIIRTMGGAD
jgi:hypothetical protein